MKNLKLDRPVELFPVPSEKVSFVARDGHGITAFWCSDGQIACSDEICILHPPLPGHSSVMAALYINMTDTVLLVISTGEIVSLRDFSLGSETTECELVAKFPGGLDAAALDPSEELLAAVGSFPQSSVILINCLSGDYAIEGCRIEGRGREEMVSVGWGKKETQFHGTAKKLAALQIEVATERLAEGDEKKGLIAWRGSEYFCASFVDASGGTEGRRIRIFDRKGTHLSTSEPVEALEPTLDWCQDVSVIASSRINPKTKLRQIIFFERNGLRHYEFDLTRPVAVRKIAWNQAGQILGVLFEDGVLQLWSTLNYHWYLKCEYLADSRDFWWKGDNEIMCASKSTLESYRIREQFDCHESMVAVVDGNSLLLTPFNLANIPPPMSFAKIDISFFPSSVTLSKTDKTILVAAQNYCGQYCLHAVDVKLQKYDMVKSGLIDGRICILNGQSTFYINRSGSLLLYESDQNPVLHGLIDCKPSQIHKEYVICLHENDKLTILQSEDLKVAHSCYLEHSDIHEIDVLKNDPGSFHIVYRRGSKLFVDNNELIQGCLSVLFSPDFTFVTTSAQKLYSLPNRIGSSNSHFLEWSRLIGKESEESCRMTEGGSQLLCCDAQEGMLVLLMPRGNTETIYPRSMVLKTARALLNKLEYRSAYLLLRRHRIDLNFIHDHNPGLFLKNIERFVSQLHEPQHLNIFLSSLSSDNVTVTKYTSNNNSSSSEMITEKTLPEKTSNVCRAVLEYLRPNSQAYIETIMTAYICSSPQNVKAALSEILRLAQQGVDSKVLEKSIKYIMFLVPPEELYECALGMYELGLALTIAKRSQMDPKEYVPLIDSFAKLDGCERLFRIDDHLGNHSEALSHLYSMLEGGIIDIEAFVDYTVNNMQFLRAIILSSYRPSLQDHLCSSFARHLEDSGRMKEAGIMHVLGKDAGKATFLEANNLWRELLMLKGSCSVSGMFLKSNPEERIKFKMFCCYTLSNDLFAEALALKQWEDAAIMSCMHPEFSSQLDFGVIEEECASIIGQLESLSSSLGSWMARWEPLQLKFSKDPVAALLPNKSAESGELADDRSELSFAETVMSRISRISSSSKKSKKKQDKQRIRDKPGSPHERLFLQNSINEGVSQVYNLIDNQISQLIYALVMWRKFEPAATLQAAAFQVVKLVDDFCFRLDKTLKQQREKECSDMFVLRLLLEDSYSSKVTLPPSWNDRSWALSFLN